MCPINESNDHMETIIIYIMLIAGIFQIQMVLFATLQYSEIVGEIWIFEQPTTHFTGFYVYGE